MTFWSGSGSADPCLWLMDPGPGSDPDPAFFVTDLQDANKKQFLFKHFFCLRYYFLKVHLHNFSKIKVQKELQKSRNQGFSYYFCMMTEGPGSGAGSGSIPLTDGAGSGSRRPKNMWIRRIRIRSRWIRIRIWNTADREEGSGPGWEQSWMRTLAPDPHRFPAPVHSPYAYHQKKTRLQNSLWAFCAIKSNVWNIYKDSAKGKL